MHLISRNYFLSPGYDSGAGKEFDYNQPAFPVNHSTYCILGLGRNRRIQAVVQRAAQEKIGIKSDANDDFLDSATYCASPRREDIMLNRVLVDWPGILSKRGQIVRRGIRDRILEQIPSTSALFSNL
jgi:hypothetical protein